MNKFFVIDCIRAMGGLFIVTGIAFGLSGCHTIYIKNGPDASVAAPKKEIHHIGVFDNVEFSKPVNLSNRCPDGKWESVMSRTNAWQVLVALGIGAAWSPMEVGVVCKAKN